MEEWLKEACPDSKFLINLNGTLYLHPDVDVHHMDENRVNNERDNLLACTHYAHRLIHSGYGLQEGTFWPVRGDLKIDNDDPINLQRKRRAEQRKTTQRIRQLQAKLTVLTGQNYD